MKAVIPLLATLTLIAFTGCTTVVHQAKEPAPIQGLMEKPTIETSLFPSDQAVLGDEAVARILSSKVELPAKAKVALMKFPQAESYATRHYGYYYWKNEEYVRLREAQVETLTRALVGSGNVAEVTPLPTLMIPKQMSIPILREAAVRLQADLLLVYRVDSDTYSRLKIFAKDQVKAYSTCEVILLDVRTGLVPFSRVITREHTELQQGKDFDLAETTRRAEQKSAMQALEAAATDLVKFIKEVPRKANP